MIPKLINLTLHLVIKEVDSVLDDSPKNNYHVAFSIQLWRHKLIDCVLNQIPNYYTIIEDIKELPEDPTILYRCPEEQSILKALIYKSMAEVLQQNSESICGDILTEAKFQ